MEPGYGAALGIINFKSSRRTRIPGSVGDALTYDFPVLFKMIDSSVLQSVFTPRPDYSSLSTIVQAAKELEEEGARAVIGNCGYLAFYQEQVSQAVNVPVFMSSLLQVPLVYKSLKKGRKIGVLCADSQALTKRHLKGAGITESIPIVIAGLEDCTEFWGTSWRRARGGAPLPSKMSFKTGLDYRKLEEEIVGVAKKLVSENPDIGAIVSECTGLPPFGWVIQKATRLPVFDLVTLVNYVHSAVTKKRYSES